MIARTTARLIILGACILGLSALGSEKNPVPRPYKSTVAATKIVDLVTGQYETWGVGTATHLGSITVHTVGTLIVELDPFEIIPLSQNGTATAANGDQYSWVLQGGAVVITGGTGRFTGATGSITNFGEYEDLEATIDWGTMTLTMTCSASVGGTIVY